MKTGKRRIIRLEELASVLRRSRLRVAKPNKQNKTRKSGKNDPHVCQCFLETSERNGANISIFWFSDCDSKKLGRYPSNPDKESKPVTWGPFLESPEHFYEKPFVKLRPGYSARLVFSYVEKGWKIKLTVRFVIRDAFVLFFILFWRYTWWNAPEKLVLWYSKIVVLEIGPKSFRYRPHIDVLTIRLAWALFSSSLTLSWASQKRCTGQCKHMPLGNNWSLHDDW